jgi:hypothetical protein
MVSILLDFCFAGNDTAKRESNKFTKKYRAGTGVNLRLVQERWPKVQFHTTREHGQQLG